MKTSFEKQTGIEPFESTRIGVQWGPCFWVERSQVYNVLKSYHQYQLELVSAAQMEDTVLITYFLSSSEPAERFAVRCALELLHAQAQPKMVSVGPLWAKAKLFENELARDFGIFFDGNAEANQVLQKYREPLLRK